MSPAPHLVLREMTEEEWGELRRFIVRDYADAQVRAGSWDEDEALRRAETQMEEMMPEGRATQGKLLLSADNGDGERVGSLWLSIDERPSGPRGESWINYIEISAPFRGKGYGRALLSAAEETARAHGLRSIGLNVFAENTVARRLYDSAGFDVVTTWMRKSLEAT